MDLGGKVVRDDSLIRRLELPIQSARSNACAKPHDRGGASKEVVPMSVRETPESERREGLVAEVPGPSKPRSMPTHEIDRVKIDEACGRKLTAGVRNVSTQKKLPKVGEPKAVGPKAVGPKADSAESGGAPGGTSVETGGLVAGHTGASEQEQPDGVPAKSDGRKWMVALAVGAGIVGLFVLFSGGNEGGSADAGPDGVEPKGEERGAEATSATGGIEPGASGPVVADAPPEAAQPEAALGEPTKTAVSATPNVPPASTSGSKAPKEPAGEPSGGVPPVPGPKPTTTTPPPDGEWPRIY